jgi:hypothetical protein
MFKSEDKESRFNYSKNRLNQYLYPNYGIYYTRKISKFPSFLVANKYPFLYQKLIDR